MKILGLLVIVVLLVALPMVFSRNPQVVDFHYHFDSLNAPLSHLLLAAFCAGLLAAFLIILPAYFGYRWRLRKSRKRIIALEAQAGVDEKDSTVDSITLSRSQQKKALLKRERKRSRQATREAGAPVTTPAQPQTAESGSMAATAKRPSN